jgi:hypothetical protein
MPALCVKCAKAPSLSEVISKGGSLKAKCAICGALNVMSLECSDVSLRNLFRALIRYHFSEWDYNTHYGGDDLERLFYRENPITAYENGWHFESYELALQEIFDTGYENYDEGISLFSGPSRSDALPLHSIKSSSDKSLLKLRKKLERRNYFLFEKDVQKLFKPHIQKLEQFIEKDNILYRARIGSESRATPLVGWGEEWHYKPYLEDQLSAPPPLTAGGGRLNRPGVSYLYLATDEETSISEVRPHPGHCVSVGAFKSGTRLRVADFNAVSILGYSQSDLMLDQFVFLKTIDELFSLPVPPEERGKYSFTQFLSEAIRHLGFEGIAYKSSVGKGVNLTVFDPQSFSYVADSARVLHVDHLKYQYSILPPWMADEEYMTDLDGNYLQ